MFFPPSGYNRNATIKEVVNNSKERESGLIRTHVRGSRDRERKRERRGEGTGVRTEVGGGEPSGKRGQHRRELRRTGLTTK